MKSLLLVACTALQVPSRVVRSSSLASVAAMDRSNELPAPAVNDVVAFAGDWPGESLVGQIRSVQKGMGGWLADVVPLEEQAGSVWRMPSGPKARATRQAVDVRELVPLTAKYVRESDAWSIVREGTVAPGLNGTAVGLERRAEGYRKLEPNFVPVGGFARLDYEGEKLALADYELLKQRIVNDTIAAGAAGLVVAYAFGGVADAAAFAVGAVASLVYVLLLTKAADKTGAVMDERDFSGARLGPPVLAFVFVALYHVLQDPASVHAFQLVPRDEFVATTAGVLSYRAPLLYRELGSELGSDDVINALPGSLATAARMVKTPQVGEEPALDGMAANTVLVLCGPPGAGAANLAARLLRADDRFVAPRWTRVADPDQDMRRFADGYSEDRHIFDPPDVVASDSVTRMQIDNAANDFAVDRNSWVLRTEELLGRTDAKVPVIACDVTTAKQLEDLEGARLIGVWVSVDNLNILEDTLTREEARRLLAADPDQDPKILAPAIADTVRAKLVSVVDDIDFGITSPMFEFTVLNAAVESDAAFAKVERAARYVFI